MHAALQFVHRYGYLLLFANVFAEQLGLPLPAVPILLAFGALAGLERFSLAGGLALAILAALLADSSWYGLGRRRGAAVLRLLCKISLEPDSCVRQTENVFLRYGARTLLFAKFVPGLSAAFPPLAGNFRMPLWRFWVFDGLGSLAWAGAYMGIGWTFRNQLDAVLANMMHLGSSLAALIVGALAGYIGYKYIARRRFYRELRIARIEPAELYTMMNGEERVYVVDLRNELERENDPTRIPGAIMLQFGDIEAGLAEVPREQDVVLYCT